MLDIRSLGQTAFHLTGNSLGHSANKQRVLLLIYLAETDAPQPRQKMASYLWPESDSGRASVNLRTLLTRMRAEGLEPYLKITRSSIALASGADICYDLRELQGILNTLESADIEDLLRVEKLYQGPFCADLPWEQFPALQEWADAVQYGLEMRLTSAFARLCENLLALSDFAHAAQVGRRLVTLSPYEENAQCLLLQALIADHQILEARQHLVYYRQLMAREFPGAPLGGKIRQIGVLLADPKRSQLGLVPLFSETVAAERSAPGQADIGHELRQSSPSFIGRQHEIDLLLQLLANGQRLITVAGLGGTGKTALLRHVLTQLPGYKPEKVLFVDLRSDVIGGSSENLLDSIARALRLQPFSNRPLFSEVLATLGAGRYLLALDNFEYTGHELVIRLLDRLPNLTVIITSRKRLNIMLEAVIPLRGLQVQEPNTKPDAGRSEAAQLFYLHARRVYPEFARNRETEAKVEQLCRQLGGLPLAIQLAARQINFYSLQELLALVATDLTILTASPADAAPHQPGMQGVLTNIWQTLKPVNQIVLAELSVFAGQWHRGAMEAVAPADQRIYQALLDTSLLQVEEPGWFSLHPLVKQFAAGKLQAIEHDEVMVRFCHYFLGLLDLGERFLEQTRVLEPATLHLLKQNHGNLILAWGWATAHQNWVLLEKAIISFVNYLHATSQKQAGIEQLQLLVAQLSAATDATQYRRMLGLASYGTGYLHGTSQNYLPSIEWRRRGLALLQETGDPWELAVVWMHLGFSLLTTGDKDLTAEGVAAVETAAALAEQQQFVGLAAQINNGLFYPVIFRGDWHQLRRLAETNRALFYRQPDYFTPAALRNALEAFTFLDDVSAVEDMLSFWESIGSKLNNNSAFAIWVAIARAYVAGASGDLPAAIRELQQTIPLVRQTDIRILPSQLGNLALYQARLGEINTALQTAEQALETARPMTSKLLTAQVTLRVAVVYLLAGKSHIVLPMLHECLQIGEEISNAVLIFTALYYLTIARAAAVPRPLYERIMKIGSVSPVMYQQYRGLAQTWAEREQIVASKDERETLWATDLAAVQALLEEVREYIKIEK